MTTMRGETQPLLIGVLHLLPLPGAPMASAGLGAVKDRALGDAQALVDGGADGLIIENLGDAPFTGGRVSAYTVAAMTAIAMAVRDVMPDGLMGVNVLRNDALSALGIATAVRADFIRVNIHVGAMVTDQGLITGSARATLLEKRRLESGVRIAADVMVKHAAPLGEPDVAQLAKDTFHRGAADAVIVTGSGTGQPIDLDRLNTVRTAVPGAPVWAGSGVNPDTVASVLPLIDAAIVGTWLHADADLSLPLSAGRVATMRALLC